MKKEELRKALGAEPFRPFVIRMISGHEYPVQHPENVALPTGADRAIAVHDPRDHAFAILDLPLIEGIEFNSKSTGKSSGKRRSA